MKIHVSILVLISSLFVLPNEANGGANVSKKIENLISKSGISKKSLGIAVFEAGQKKYVWRENQVMIPASLTKIVTAAAAIEMLKPQTQFTTEILGLGERDGDVFNGDIYLKGNGDPTFVSEQMWILVNEFWRTGVRHIRGKLYVDDTLFDREFFPGRHKTRVDRAYDAPISALSFNWNAVNIYARPTLKGKKLEVVLDPENNYLVLRNEAKTLAAGQKKTLQARRHLRKRQGGEYEEIHVTGGLASGAEEAVIYRSIAHPSLWAGAQLREFLRRRGIEVDGGIERRKTPKNATKMAEVESRPLEKIIKDMMKFSNNFVAEMLTKHLSLRKSSVGNNHEGIKFLREYLRTRGFKEFQLVNASGLSRENRLKAGDLAQLLSHLRQNFTVFPEFISSLPIAGVDGTLKRRLQSPNIQNWIRAKTGLLNGVVGLAGYAGRKDGSILEFALIYNGSSQKQWRAQKLFDQIAASLLK